MPLYTKVYTTYRILLSSDILRKRPVQSMNSNEQVKKSVGHASDFKLCNQVLISRAEYLTFTLKTKKMR